MLNPVSQRTESAPFDQITAEEIAILMKLVSAGPLRDDAISDVASSSPIPQHRDTTKQNRSDSRSADAIESIIDDGIQHKSSSHMPMDTQIDTPVLGASNAFHDENGMSLMSLIPGMESSLNSSLATSLTPPKTQPEVGYGHQSRGVHQALGYAKSSRYSPY